MTAFANRAAFEDPRSRLQAIGTDLSPDRAIVDAHGRVLAHARTGGMIDPVVHELHPGTVLYRFGGQRHPRDIAKGGWWIARREFQQLVNFAIGHDIFVGLAMRMLCLVPPEWSDATTLVRARVEVGLLAWRGLGNSVVTPMRGGKGMVRMPHQNEVSARRLHQLFIPGLAAIETLHAPLAIEDVRSLDAGQSDAGFLYL